MRPSSLHRDIHRARDLADLVVAVVRRGAADRRACSAAPLRESRPRASRAARPGPTTRAGPRPVRRRSRAPAIVNSCVRSSGLSEVAIVTATKTSARTAAPKAVRKMRMNDRGLVSSKAHARCSSQSATAPRVHPGAHSALCNSRSAVVRRRLPGRRVCSRTA